MQGFTIAELMIATSVFSVVLLVAAAAVLQAGRTYYKGITITQTQETTKQIMDDVSANLRLASSFSASPSGGTNYYCIGTHRYTYNLLKQVASAADYTQSGLGLVEDQPNGCGDPFGSTPFVAPTELVANNMRLIAFDISAVAGSTNLYNITLSVASGADSALSVSTTSNPRIDTAQCVNEVSNGRFCAVTTLSTIVYQGQGAI